MIDSFILDIPPPMDDMALPPPPAIAEDDLDGFDIPPPPPLDMEDDDVDMSIPPPPPLESNAANLQVDWIPTQYIRKGRRCSIRLADGDNLQFIDLLFIQHTI